MTFGVLSVMAICRPIGASMRRMFRGYLLALTALIASAGFGQATKPAFTYTLHASGQRRGAYTPRPATNAHSGELDLLPDNSLLELIPQGNERWVLKRLLDWDTPKPREDSLWIKTGRGEEEDVRFNAELLIAPKATYAFAVIESVAGNTRIVDIHPQIVVAVVDLRTFQLVNQFVTTENLFLGSWRFVPSGKLLLRREHVHGYWDRNAPIDPNELRWELTVFELPSLDRLVGCQYQDEKAGIQDADRRCARALQAAQIPTVAWFDVPDSTSNESAVRDRLGTIPDCSFGGASPDGRYGYYDCSTSKLTMWDSLKTISRRVLVLDTQTRRRIIDMGLPSSPDIAFALVESRAQNYLILLREAVKFQAYRLP
ncbi:MAG: hypothetical protein WCB94_11290 [Terriglobales bacterium]